MVGLYYEVILVLKYGIIKAKGGRVGEAPEFFNLGTFPRICFANM
jgi:hypothetical protein